MNFLLCTLLLAIAGDAEPQSLGPAKRQADTLTLSLPTLKFEEYRTTGPIWCPQATRYEWLSPTSLRLWTKDTEGTVEVVICGPGYCRIQEFTWTGPPFVPHDEPWDIPWATILTWGLIGGFLGFLALAAYTIATGARRPW